MILGPDIAALLGVINDDASRLREALCAGPTVFLTYGTAYVYRLRKGGRVVGENASVHLIIYRQNLKLCTTVYLVGNLPVSLRQGKDELLCQLLPLLELGIFTSQLLGYGLGPRFSVAYG